MMPGQLVITARFYLTSYLRYLAKSARIIWIFARLILGIAFIFMTGLNLIIAHLWKIPMPR